MLCTAEILKERLKENIEEGKERLLPRSQTDFRRGRSSIDNIFVLNHIVQREKKKIRKKGSIRIVRRHKGGVRQRRQRNDVENYGRKRNRRRSDR